MATSSPIAERRPALLHHADPLGAVEPKVAVGDHITGLLQLVLGAKDQRARAPNGRAHLATRRIERRGAGRVRIGEAPATTGELEAAGLAGAGVGGVLQERSERLGELTDAVERLDGQSVTVGAGTRRRVYDGANIGRFLDTQPSHSRSRHLMHESEEGAQGQVAAVFKGPR